MPKPPSLFLTLFGATLTLLQAQGTKTRDDASKYTAHADVGSIRLAADYWGRAIPLDDITLSTEGYLVIEVALFAPASSKVSIADSQFVLKVNGQALMPQSAGLVTLGMVVPDMRERGPRLETDTGVGPVIISTGRDPVQPKFPGDPNSAHIPPPPLAQPTAGVPAKPIDPVKAVGSAALPEGALTTPISGYLFYSWPGKLKRIKQVELDYTSPAGAATLILLHPRNTP